MAASEVKGYFRQLGCLLWGPHMSFYTATGCKPTGTTSPLSTGACWDGCPAAQLHVQTHAWVLGLPASPKQVFCMIWTSMHVLTATKPRTLKLLGQGSPDQGGHCDFRPSGDLLQLQNIGVWAWCSSLGYVMAEGGAQACLSTCRCPC